jgi:hypothetical protein
LTIRGTFRIIRAHILDFSGEARGIFAFREPDRFSILSLEFIMLRKLWQEWLRISKHIGSFNARALTTLIYFTILAIFGIPSRLFSDPLDVKKRPAASAWLDRHPRDLDLDSARRQG